jgi:hypothetical protein
VEHHTEIIEILKRIEKNQQMALQTQEKHLALAQAQLERTNERVNESIELQRLSVTRQAQVRNFVFPILALALALLVYLLFKGRVFE